MLLTDEDIQFVHDHFARLDGWCDDESAYISACIMNFQDLQQWSGGVLEIGVYQGKYLAALYRKARQRNARTVGVDTFQWKPLTGLVEPFREIFGELHDLKLLECSSRDLSATAILEHLGGRQAAFISIDGDHSAEAVEADLKLATEVLAPHGVLSVDDFLNPRAIGVSEGAYRFFLAGGAGLKPFVYCANKLYACHPEYYVAYKGAIESLTDERRELPFIQAFHKLAENGRHWVEQSLLGAAPWTF
jgi:hypothetical protein